MALLSDTVEIMDMLIQKLEDKSGILGLAYVGAYDEKRIPRYPAIVVMPGSRAKEVHATNTFQLVLEFDLYVYHSNLNLNKRERSRADLQLVKDIEETIEGDTSWLDDSDEARLIFAYISNEDPGLLQPRANKSDVVISTRLTWRALTQRRFF